MGGFPLPFAASALLPLSEPQAISATYVNSGGQPVAQIVFSEAMDTNTVPDSVDFGFYHTVAFVAPGDELTWVNDTTLEVTFTEFPTGTPPWYISYAEQLGQLKTAAGQTVADWSDLLATLQA